MNHFACGAASFSSHGVCKWGGKTINVDPVHVEECIIYPIHCIIYEEDHKDHEGHVTLILVLSRKKKIQNK